MLSTSACRTQCFFSHLTLTVEHDSEAVLVRNMREFSNSELSVGIACPAVTREPILRLYQYLPARRNTDNELSHDLSQEPADFLTSKSPKPRSACEVVIQKGNLSKTRVRHKPGKNPHGATCLDSNFRLICLGRL